MFEGLHIDFNKVTARLSIIENGQYVRYHIKITSNNEAILVTNTFDNDFKCIGSKSETVTKNDLCQNTTRNDLLIWVARGMWGIPFRYREKL